MKNATTRQTKFILALLDGNTVAQSADLAGVAERTAFLWLKEDVVKDQLREVQTQAMLLSGARLTAVVVKAIDALEDVIDRPAQTGAGNKRLAAGTVLDLCVKWQQAVNYEDRILELERLVKKKDG